VGPHFHVPPEEHCEAASVFIRVCRKDAVTKANIRGSEWPIF
jgi:hypothetical protein